MRNLILCFSVAFMAANVLTAAPTNQAPAKSNCRCKNCRCTPDNHCGCRGLKYDRAYQHPGHQNNAEIPDKF